MTEDDPALRLLALWGLRAGRQLYGWTATRVTRTPAGDAVLVRFARELLEFEVRLEREGDRASFRRVGALDITHSIVAPELERTVSELLVVFVAWLSKHGAGHALPPLLPRIAAPIAAPVAAPIAAPVAEHAYEGGEAPPLDPATRMSSQRPFLRFETIERAELAKYPDALREMYHGSFGGLLVRGVYDKEFMAHVVAELAQPETKFPRTSFPARFRAHFYGRCLDGSDPELGEYLNDAARFREQTEALFRGAVPFETRMEEVFRAIAGGREVCVPRYIDGRVYSPATIRILLEAGQIGTHCGNEAATRPAYTHLNTLIDRGDQISYFLTLQEAQAGGELIVYSLKWSDIDASRIVNGRSQVDDLLRHAEWLAVAPTAGDLLLFDGGRYFHRVAKVEGPQVRWTLGGFMMFDKPGRKILYWS